MEGLNYSLHHVVLGKYTPWIPAFALAIGADVDAIRRLRRSGLLSLGHFFS